MEKEQGSKAKKPLTAQEQLDMDIMAETELARLQRQYRIMEGDRLAFSEETGSKLAKQRRVIDTLRREQQNLENDLNVATSEGMKRRDDQMMARLQELLREHDLFIFDYKREKTHLNEVEYQIKKLEKQVIDLKAKQLTEEQWQSRVSTARKTLETLENKLDTVTKRFCSILTENKKLREEIDHLLKERAHFNGMWEKLIYKLNQGKKFMLDLIEQATIAYDQREEWCTKLQALRVRAHNDVILHTQDMRELERQIDHDSKLQEFLEIKSQRRVMKDLEEKEAKKREELRKNMEKTLALYKETLDKIKEFCEEDDIDRLEAMFLKQEEENFALFNYVNELNHELEGLSDSIAKLRVNIDEQRLLNNKRAEKQMNTLNVLKEKAEKAKHEADDAEKRLQECEGNLSNLLKSIEKLFALVKCDNAPILELLGNNATINNYNVLLYLGLLEKRITELITSCYYKEKHDKHKKVPHAIREIKENCTLQAVEKYTPMTPCPLCVEHEMVSDVIDDLQFARSRVEVEDALKERLEIAGGLDRLHNVSKCFLPKSRQIIQKRYQ